MIKRSDFVERTDEVAVWTDAERLDLLQPTRPLERTEVIELLYYALRGRQYAPEFTLVEDKSQSPKEIKISPEEFARVARNAAGTATRSDRTWADFLRTAYGTDAYHDEALISETDLHFTSGQQSFLEPRSALRSRWRPSPAADSDAG